MLCNVFVVTLLIQKTTFGYIELPNCMFRCNTITGITLDNLKRNKLVLSCPLYQHAMNGAMVNKKDHFLRIVANTDNEIMLGEAHG